jgi:chemotaxis protein methyltransferase WspC
MSLTEIESLLQEKIGLGATIIGTATITRAVNTRRAKCGNCDLSTYRQMLQNSSQELAQLIELLVIPETWFFRDRYPFEFLISHARTTWLNPLKISKIHLLSLPCSTGEEPLSLAIALLEAGLNPHQFQIDAVDISQNALDKAKQGIYRKNSFRGETWLNYNPYFQTTPDGKKLSP